MSWDFFKTAFATLLVTLDPPGLAPAFIALTATLSPAGKREAALRASIYAFLILAAFALGGGATMAALGISFPAFRIAGGLLLFYISFEMIFELRAPRRQTLASDAVEIDRVRHVAAFPLAIPLMAGPGAITATMLLADRTGGDPALMAGLLGLAALIVAACWLTFLAAERVSGLLGRTGNVVLTRMLGVVLSALAVQFVINGVMALR
ncbi:MAG: MarC family protein [Hyphomicrobiales bacterium]|nr:MarC family protein [Hyphomicrobiales bacterium]MDE2018081.1 MarC family protein [Hyphomicrobiales bacterium]